MSEPKLSTGVNAHYLDKVMELSETKDILASEDIFDARGNKLLAKGARVSRALQEKLIVHKLVKPLEACIAVEGGVNNASVMTVAQKLMESGGKHIFQTPRSNSDPMEVLASLKFGSAMSMMLTIADKDGDKALEHAVSVSMLSISIAARAGLPVLDQRIAGMAGLLHDIGELYVNPIYMTGGKRLLPHEWAHLVVHPHTGQILVTELETLPPAVGRAIAEHHERFDGTGYPRRLKGNEISTPGQVVALAEMVAGLLGKNRPFDRMGLALKIVPGEHSPAIVNAMGTALRDAIQNLPCDNGTDLQINEVENVGRLIRRIRVANMQVAALLDSTKAMSARFRELLHTTAKRIGNVDRAVISTGLDMHATLPHEAGEDALLMFEKEVATREIQWRLRDIARDIAPQTGEQHDRLLVTPIINVLDDDFSLETYGSETISR